MHVLRWTCAIGRRGLKSVVNEANASVPPKNHIMQMLNGSVNAGVGMHFARKFITRELKTPKMTHSAAVCMMSVASSECACSSKVAIARPTRIALKPYRPSVCDAKPSEPRESIRIAVAVPDSNDNTP